jgi:hypothetical protein
MDSIDEASRAAAPIGSGDDHSQTIDEFCHGERISRATFFQMQTEGWGPQTMAVGAATRISPEARREWRREREKARRLGIRRALPKDSPPEAA